MDDVTRYAISELTGCEAIVLGARLDHRFASAMANQVAKPGSTRPGQPGFRW